MLARFTSRWTEQRRRERVLVRLALVPVGASALALGGVAFVLATTTSVPRALRGATDWRGDAVFVPSGDPENQRTLQATAIVKQGRARLLVIAGAGVAGDSSAYLGDVAQRAGLPAGALVLERRSTSTWDNFVLARPLLAQNGVHRLLIVTNREHARRAVLSARAALPGVEVAVQTVDDGEVPTYIRILEVVKLAHQIRAGHLPPGALVSP